MTKKFSGRTLLILGALIVGVVLGGAAIAVGGTTLSPSPEGKKIASNNSSTEAEPAADLSGGSSAEALATVRAKLAVLGTPADNADLPTDSIAKSSLGRNVIADSAVRKLGASKSGARFYAVPVYGGGELPFKEPGVCLVDQDAAGTCTPASAIARGESILFADHLPELGDDEARLTGIAPNGVSEVTVTVRDGKPVTVPVSNNLYVYEGNFSPESVSWTVGGSTTTHRVPGA